MSSRTALEDAFGLEVPSELQGLRRLLYRGEWIESHALQMDQVAIYDSDEYPFIGRRIRSTRGKDIALEAWPETFAEEQVPHSTALHARTSEGGTYLCGPAARFALNQAQLAEVPRKAAEAIALTPIAAANPFRSLLVRGVETLLALEEACRRVEGLSATFEPLRRTDGPSRRGPRGVGGTARYALPPLPGG